MNFRKQYYQEHCNALSMDKKGIFFIVSAAMFYVVFGNVSMTPCPG